MKTIQSSAKSKFLAVLLASTFCAPAFAEGPAPAAPAAGERVLALEGAKKEVVRHSMVGIRDTLVFYTLAGQQAVLELSIDNTSAAFKTSGTVYLFDPGTTEESLGKWINNQHSDGLFADAPTPTLSLKLPDGSCTVKDSKVVGEEKNPTSNDMFKDYQVKISVKAHHVEGKYRLAAFESEANVYLKK